MPVKLIVKSIVDATYATEAVYTQARITLGRDSANALCLPDDKRILSKEHAEIRMEGGRVEVMDLGSKNFTYLNGERLPGQEARALDTGDVLRLGDYEVQVVLLDAPEPPSVLAAAPADDRTVFAFNPFWEHAAQFRDLLRRVDEVYAREMPERRQEALREAFADAFEGAETGEVASVIATALGGAAPPAPSYAAPAGSDAYRAPAAPEPPPRPPEVPTVPFMPAAQPAPAARPSPLPETTLGALVETLLRYVAGLLGIPWQFRHEFIGQTIVQSEASAVLYEGQPETLQAFLLDPNAPPEEAARRRALLADAAESLRLHQVALLDGYKASVQQGVQHFLAEVDLEQVEQRVAAEAKWYQKPFLRVHAARALQEKVAALRAEDWTVTERRVFRPAFIKAYLARMTSVPR